MRSGDSPQRVRFVLASAAGLALNGVCLPAFGVFLDQNGEVIEIVVDESDPFRRMTRGMFFSKMEAKQALHGPQLRGMTTHAHRRAIFADIARSGVARSWYNPLEQALIDFNRPTWGVCEDHLHVYVRGEILHPVSGTSAARSALEGKILATRLVDERLLSSEDAERLVEGLGSDPRLEELAIDDPPRMVMRITVLVG